MLSISPKKDISVLEKYQSKNAVVLMCDDDGVEKGYVAFVQNGYVLDIVGFEVYYCDRELKGESYIIADTLIKSLGSYALNHSCYYIECSKLELFDILSNFAFSENGDKLTTNLQLLFKGCNN